MLVLPRIAGPAARSLRTTVASYGGTQPSRIREPQVVGSPAVASTSLIASGTPASGEAARPAARRSSDGARPAASAPSASTCRKACTSPSTAAMRSRWAWVTSTRGGLTRRPVRRPARRGRLRRSSAHCSSPGSAAPRTLVLAPAGRPRAPAPGSGTGCSTSSRKTLVSGSGCDVGGMSSAATPLIEATDSRITASCGARWSSSASSRSMRARSARWRDLVASDHLDWLCTALGHEVDPRQPPPPARRPVRPGGGSAQTSVHDVVHGELQTVVVARTLDQPEVLGARRGDVEQPLAGAEEQGKTSRW